MIKSLPASPSNETDQFEIRYYMPNQYFDNYSNIHETVYFLDDIQFLRFNRVSFLFFRVVMTS